MNLEEIESFSDNTYLDPDYFDKIGASLHPGKRNKPRRVPDSTLGLLATIARHFLTLIPVNFSERCDSDQCYWENIDEKDPSTLKLLTPSNLAFLVLVLQHYLPRWKWEAARRRRRTYGSKITLGEEPKLFFVDGIAGKEAKDRFSQLEEYFRFRFFPSSRNHGTPQETQALDNMRRLLRILRKLPGSMIHMSQNTIISHDDLLSDILHYVFYKLEMWE